MAKQTVQEKPPESDMSAMVCACENFTRGDMRKYLTANPGVGFDTFLDATNTGQTCTACLLDLECDFVEVGKTVHPAGKVATGAVSAKHESLSLKRRLYRLIDGLSPQVPVKLWEVLPVLYGNGMSQSVIIANHSLLFENELAAPPVNVTLTLRDPRGKVIFRDRQKVEKRTIFRRELSGLLAEAAGNTGSEEAFEIGSVIVTRQAASNGYLGTTRPQTELVGKTGCTSVHGNAARYNQGGEITFDARRDTRRFLSFVSTDRNPADISVYYPVPLYGGWQDMTPQETVTVPANGAALVEIPMNKIGKEPEAGPNLCRVVWRGQGVYKTHAYNSDMALGHMSIDHV